MPAQYKLATCYEGTFACHFFVECTTHPLTPPLLCESDGEGVDLDLGRALELYEQAARKHHAKAQFRLGRMIATGKGVARDPVRARLLLNSAFEGGCLAARDVLAAMEAELAADSAAAAALVAADVAAAAAAAVGGEAAAANNNAAEGAAPSSSSASSSANGGGDPNAPRSG